MAKQKTINQQAKVGNEDLIMTFQFIKTAVDEYGEPIKELTVALHIRHDNGPDGYGRLIVDNAITAGERSNLNSLLVKLRDAILIQEGYIDV